MLQDQPLQAEPRTKRLSAGANNRNELTMRRKIDHHIARTNSHEGRAASSDTSLNRLEDNERIF